MRNTILDLEKNNQLSNQLSGGLSLLANSFKFETHVDGHHEFDPGVAKLINGTNFGDALEGTDGDDTINGYGGDDEIHGAGGNDTINAGDGIDFVGGGDGNDTINGGNGDDILVGELGNDTINGNDGNDDLSGNEGDDTIRGGNGSDYINGNEGNDTLYGENDNDFIYGNEGNDKLYGGAGADRLDGGAGTDTADYTFSNAGVTINLLTNINTGGHAQGDTLFNIENITGSNYNDTLTGNNANNTINGGGGNDVIIGGGGNDTINGGNGIDTASYLGSLAAVNVNLLTNVNTGGDAQGDKLSNIENITGSAFNDTLTGNNTDNIINGGGGNDVINGGLGNDTFDFSNASGLTWNQTFQMSITTWGGGWVVGSTFQYASGTDLNTGIHTEYSGHGNTYKVETDTLTSIENVNGSNYEDYIVGNSLDNIINAGSNSRDEDIVTAGAGNDTIYGGNGYGGKFFGEDGNDTIYAVNQSGSYAFSFLSGGAGDDKLYGGAGDDILQGDSGNYANSANLSFYDAMGNYDYSVYIGNPLNDKGNDILSGGAGNDYLEGGYNNDTLTGGTGSDVFYFYKENGSVDHITDFKILENDSVTLSKYNFYEGNMASVSYNFTTNGIDLIMNNTWTAFDGTKYTSTIILDGLAGTDTSLIDISVV